jgi:hypothetical protein
MSRDVDQPEGFTLTGIQVDVDGLAAFRSMLHLELERNLRPGAQRIINDQMGGYGFGVNSASASVSYAQDVYLDALSASTNNLTMYIRIAQVLIDEIHDVVTRYGEADLSADDLVTRVGTRLSAANQAAQAPQPYTAAL